MEALKERVEQALADFSQGIPLLLMDDHQRENEADLVVHAEKITEQQMAMMIRDGSGIVCLCLSEQLASLLQLPEMVSDNQSAHGTRFTVSIDARANITTGVSAQDRLHTVHCAAAPSAVPEDLARPGHIFPLIAAAGGIAERRGHTEGSVALAALADMSAAVVICELMTPNGHMAKGDEITRYAAQHSLKCLSIEDISLYINLPH